jgi:hypothetical protein
MFLSSVGTFLIVRVNRESRLGFLDLRRFLYLAYSLLYLLAVQVLQIRRPQLTESVWRCSQFLHSMTTKSAPQLVYLSANLGLRDWRELVRADSKSGRVLGVLGIPKMGIELSKASSELPTLMPPTLSEDTKLT